MKTENENKARILRLMAALASLLCITALALAVTSADESEESAKKKETCFKPGAEVTFEFFFVAPPGFHLGEEPLAVVSFDKKSIKKLPLTVNPLEYSWSREELAPEEDESGHEQTTVAANLKVKLDSKCVTGELKIPVSLDVYYCNIDEGWCTSCHYDAALNVIVSDDKDALKQGALKVAVVVTPEF